MNPIGNYDCRVCHEAEYDGGHQNGLVQLTDPDDEGTTYTESSSGAFQPENLTATDIANLTTFCSNCHDSDGATRFGSAAQDPFDDDGDPPGTATPHGNTDFEAAIEGDFETGCIQCHAGHGTDNLSIIQSDVVIAEGVTTSVAFAQLTGTDSFDESDSTDTDDLCAACHASGSNPGTPMQNHNGGDHTSVGGSDERGTNCTTCHTHDSDGDSGTLDGFMLDADDCTACHVGAMDKANVGPSGGRQAVVDDFGETSHHVAGTLDDDDCQVCHDAELDSGNHANGLVQLTDPDSGTTTYAESSAGAFRPVNLTAGDLADLTSFCENCHDGDGATRLGGSAQSPFSGGTAPPAVTTHSNTADVGRAEGPFTKDCAQCHDGHGSSNLSIIRQEVVVVPGTTVTPVVFTSRTGTNSFDESDSADADDLCTTCHSNAANPGYPMTDHVGGNHGTGYDERGEDCTTCHPHDRDSNLTTDDGMMPTGGTNCIACHDTAQDRSDVAGPSGGREAVESEFASTSHHASGGVANADCQVCHDAELDGGNHANGYVNLTDPNTPATVYAETGPGAFRPANITTADITTLTTFCTNCHDGDGANGDTDPFSGGAPATTVSTHSNVDFGGAVEESFQNGCAQCHGGHGSDNLSIIRSTIVVTPGTTAGPVVFTALTGADSFDESDADDTDDLCAACHVNPSNPGYAMSSHVGGDHTPAGGSDDRGTNCASCHFHDIDGSSSTHDGFTHITAPEMDVWGNGHAIADGDATPDTADHTDFGDVVSGGGAVTRTFTISNTGSGALHLTGTPLVTITGDIADFAVVVAPATPVAVGDSTTFQVHFAPASLGLRSATLTIANDDVNENPYEFAIQGRSVPLASDLALTKTVAPAIAGPGQTITYTLSFSNAGAGVATHVVITDQVPISQFSFFDVVGSSGAAITATGGISYVWEVEELSVGEWGIITMTGVLSDPLAAGPFTNAASITATTSDSNPDNNSSAADVTVKNVGPVAGDDSGGGYGTDEDTSIVLSVLENDTDDNGDVLSVVAVGVPTSGSAAISGATQIVYTPTNHTTTYVGVFTYTVSDGSLSDTATVTVSVVADNDSPVADDDTVSTDEDTNATGTISASDPDTNDTLSYSIAAQPVYGSAAVNPSTSAWTYTPINRTAGYTATFTVAVTDTGGLTDAATVTVSVTADNDAPVADDNTANIDEDTDALGTISASDLDTNDTLSYGVTAQPTHGGAAINPYTGAWTYTPANRTANYTITFAVVATDSGNLTDTATVTVSIIADNDAPVADDDPFTVDEDSSDNTLDVLNGDADVDSDTLTIFAVGTPDHTGTVVNSNTVITYTPAADFFGTETFTYTVSDGSGGYDTASIVITVNNLNDAPVAVDDAYNTTKDASLTVVAPGVLDNDSDIDNDSLEAVLDSAPANGTLELNTDGSFTYAPTSGFSGVDHFTYHSHDDVADSNVVTVEIVVNESNGYAVFLPLALSNHIPPHYPNDPDYDYQWAWEMIKAPAAWSYSKGENVLIAVVDTGTDLDHPDLASKVRTDIDYDFVNDDDEADDDHGHGTHISGIAAAATDNSIGVAGMGWEAMILPLKIISQDNDGDIVDLAAAIHYAVDNGADVINMSVGGTTDPCCDCPAIVQAAVNYAYEKGVVLVAAAGNSGSSVEMFPANCEHVLGVAATNTGDTRAAMSNYGNHVSVAAPGLGIYSTGQNDLYYPDSGTSTATPHIAGLAALLIARYPSYTPDEIASAILDNADDLGQTGWDPYYGCGRINAYRSLFQGKRSDSPLCLQETGPWIVDGIEATTAPFVPGEIIVFFRPGTKIETMVQQYEVSIEFLPAIGAWRLLVPAGQEREILDRLRGSSTVTYAELNYAVSIQ